MKEKFTSYIGQDLDRDEIKKLSTQYQDINMWELEGIDEDNFPFVVKMGNDNEIVMVWNKYNGIMACAHDDPVYAYAFAMWLSENAHPVFENIQDAQQYAIEHDWPRKERNA